MGMVLQDELMLERRARLQAERLLQMKQGELLEANRRLSKDARDLSVEILESHQRQEALLQQHDETRVALDLARGATQIAEQRLWHSIETIEDGFAVFDDRSIMVVANAAYLAPFDGIDAVGPGIWYEEILRIAVEEGLVDTEGLSRAEWVSEMRERWHCDVIPPKTIQLWNGTFARLVDRRAQSGDTVSIALNITAETRFQAKLARSRKRAEAASRAKSSFLAKMSHEIRTPMNGVVGMAQLLSETNPSEEQKLYIDTIRSSGEALLVLINDVLDFSKIDAERLNLHPEKFDLEQAVYDVARLLRPGAQEKGVEVLVDYDMFMPQFFVGDPGRVRQIITNLVGNAVKFTETGYVLIRVSSFPDEADATHRLHITVEDTGIGIDPEKKEHIFGEFNQVDDERNRKFQGTGLGLAIALRLVSMMGGEIWVDSEPGKGSSFGFYIQLDHADGVLPAEKPTLPAWLRHVYIADPDDNGRDILRRQLASAHVQTRCFDDLNALLDAQPGAGDVVLLDGAFKAPEVAKAARALRESGFENAIYVMGASVDDSSVPVNGTLPKPLKRFDVPRVIANLMVPEIVVESKDEAPDLQPGAQGTMRVLAAEDNKTNRLVFSKLVKSARINLTFAKDGREAVAQYKALRPHLVFMDISMPEVDGKEATGQIRAYEAEHELP
ncbi:MAG: ATP-binding protein, partial [Pseudomonadota bacterium]